MALGKKVVSTVDDDPWEGKKMVCPQCVNCEHNKGDYCEFFQMARLRLLASGKVDIFNCPEFVSKY